jgi:hypothetical protein
MSPTALDPAAVESRVAVLEEIARSTREALADIRAELREFRTEIRSDMSDLRSDMRELRREQKADFRWLLGISLGASAGLLGAMAHGFHWLQACRETGARGHPPRLSRARQIAAAGGRSAPRLGRPHHVTRWRSLCGMPRAV